MLYANVTISPAPLDTISHVLVLTSSFLPCRKLQSLSILTLTASLALQNKTRPECLHTKFKSYPVSMILPSGIMPDTAEVQCEKSQGLFPTVSLQKASLDILRRRAWARGRGFHHTDTMSASHSTRQQALSHCI